MQETIKFHHQHLEMKKEFNITGICFPEDHYMMDNSAKFKEVLDLVHRGKYFIINRPRQYGKSTLLYQLMTTLEQTPDYLPIALNFQGLDKKWLATDGAFAAMIIREFYNYFKYVNAEIAAYVKNAIAEVQSISDLSVFITELVHKFKKKLVLLIDEVDSSSEYAAFLNFLGMLRTKYLGRKRAQHATFHSVVLAGVHDVKALKYKLRNPEEAKYDSPWNIAVDFTVEMAFSKQEIIPMLEAYSLAENVNMDTPAIAERLYYYTSGYPFLVSKLCLNIATQILPKKKSKTWTLKDVETAVQLLLSEDNTNFKSLIGNMENNKNLYDLAYLVIIQGAIIPYNAHEPVLQLGRMYGVFKSNGRLKIHNRIYEQILYDYMASKALREYLAINAEGLGDITFVNPDNTLNLEKVLEKFQTFMKEQRSSKDKSFIERQWRLIFLAFLQPIINGKGYAFREVEISEEKRLDILITYAHLKYVLELKIWRGPKKHKEGLEQLKKYLDVNSLEKGYLIIFDNRKRRTWDAKPIKYKGKEIFAVWV